MKNLTILDEALLISLGLSKSSARIVVNEIVSLRQEIADLEASRALANEGAARLAAINDELRVELAAQQALSVRLNEERDDERLKKKVWFAMSQELRAEVERLRSCAENLTFRNAQKACETCDGPTIAEVNQLRAELAIAERHEDEWASVGMLIAERDALRSCAENLADSLCPGHNLAWCLKEDGEACLQHRALAEFERLKGKP
jgi:hypothetical protein